MPLGGSMPLIMSIGVEAELGQHGGRVQRGEIKIGGTPLIMSPTGPRLSVTLLTASPIWLTPGIPPMFRLPSQVGYRTRYTYHAKNAFKRKKMMTFYH